MKRPTFLAILILLLAPVICHAQSPKKILVDVRHYGDDPVGRRFAFALKEAIRASQSFLLLDMAADMSSQLSTRKKGPIAFISMELRSLDTSGGAGLASAIATTIVCRGTTESLNVLESYITTQLQHCGIDRAESCAKNLLPALDEAVQMLRQRSPDLWKAL
jgi:hypothetical protein